VGAAGAGRRAVRAGPETARGHDRGGEDHRALSDAVRRVERQTKGQVLSAERVPYDGRDVSRVKVVDSSGRVRIYMDDPQSKGDGRVHAVTTTTTTNLHATVHDRNA
jgi:hypothetical protein